MCANYLFFFFQAEDGIRDIGVTGVQTCALPISPRCTWRACARTCSTSSPPSRSPRCATWGRRCCATSARADQTRVRPAPSSRGWTTPRGTAPGVVGTAVLAWLWTAGASDGAAVGAADLAAADDGDERRALGPGALEDLQQRVGRL